MEGLSAAGRTPHLGVRVGRELIEGLDNAPGAGGVDLLGGLVLWVASCVPPGAVAQLVAHLHGMEGVRGSSPLSSTLVVVAPDVHSRSGATTSPVRTGGHVC